MDKNLSIARFGLGYVGLPLAIEFGKVREVIGYDIYDKTYMHFQKSILGTYV